MITYCESHRRPHEFTPGEAERIMYTLAAMLNDAEHEDPARDDDPSLTLTVCPAEALNLSRSGEGHMEHVDAMIERRRAAVRAGVTAR